MLDPILRIFEDTSNSLLVVGEFDASLVILSISIAILASFMAFQVASQAVYSVSTVRRQITLLVSSFALGGGVWSMHFIGMLAFDLCTDVTYGWDLTLLSLIPAVLASWVAQNLIIRQKISLKELVFGGVLVGAGIGTMHYLGMAAMEMAPLLRYDLPMFLTSIIVAIVLAIMALSIRFSLNKLGRISLSELSKTCIASVVMGSAISGMHYTGMAAARFVLPPGMELSKQTDHISYLLALAVTCITVFIIFVVIGINIVIKYRDISNRAISNEKRLIALMDTAVDGIVTIDDKGIILGINRAVRTLLGWQESELIGQNVKKIVPEPDRTNHDQYLANYLVTGEAKIIGKGREVEAETKTGESIPVHLEIGQFKIEKQQLFVAFISDMRVRKEMESALRENEARFRSLLGNLPGMAYRCLNHSGRPYLYLSDEVENMFGYPAKDFTYPNPTRSTADFVHPDDLAIITDTNYSDPNGFAMEYRIIDRFGVTKWLIAYGRLLSSEDGKQEYIDGFVKDITQRKEMEVALIKQKEKAEQAAASRAAFLANMSHEIRTPLNAVVGFSEILLDDELTTPQRKQISTINQSAKSLMHILNDVLDSAKLDKGKFQLEYRDFSLVEEIDAVVSTLWLEAEKKGVLIELSIDSDTQGYYNGAPDRLRQVLTNILGNAVKFTQAGQILINVDKNKQDFIVISVKDTGIGMTPEQLETVFDAFEQADESMSRRFGGTGLGTTISKQLVELMGGNIYAKSELDVGSTFTFELPLKSIDSPNDSALPKATISLPPLNILVVDDIEQNIELLTILLKRQGHSVIVARDGEQALCRMRTENPELVLMDIQMPVMDGLTATRKRREEEAQQALKHMPIIALTASVLEQDRVSADAAGIDGFANKPVDIELLNWQMAKVLGLQNIQLSDISKQSTSNDTIDFDAGIALWGSKTTFYREVHNFIDEHGQVPTDLKLMQDAGDWSGLKSKLHAIKGVAGNLALLKVMNVIGDMEAAIATKRYEDFNQAISILSSALQDVAQCGGASESQTQVEPQPTRLEINKEELIQVLQSLQRHVKINEINESLMEKMAQVDYKEFPEVRLIEQAINDFEFTDASKYIEEFITRLTLN